MIFITIISTAPPNGAWTKYDEVSKSFTRYNTFHTKSRALEHALHGGLPTDKHQNHGQRNLLNFNLTFTFVTSIDARWFH